MSSTQPNPAASTVVVKLRGYARRRGGLSVTAQVFERFKGQLFHIQSVTFRDCDPCELARRIAQLRDGAAVSPVSPRAAAALEQMGVELS